MQKLRAMPAPTQTPLGSVWRRSFGMPPMNGYALFEARSHALATYLAAGSSREAVG
jgi:hypothetical protein